MSPACSPLCSGIGRAILSTLLLSGLCSCLHHYYFIDQPMTWGEARGYCRKKYTDLATVDNMEDMERLIAAAGSGYEGTVWIGLHDKFSWRWSMFENGIPGENNWGFRRWKKGEPNTSRIKQLCVAVQEGVWDDYLCTQALSFVCYNNTNNLPATSSEEYFFINESKTWYSAQAYCRQNYTDLPSVRNLTENGLIQDVVQSGQAAWIGLRRNTWQWWLHGTSSFRYWADGHPLGRTGNCATSVINATHLGKWVENHCTERFHFMCQNNKKQLFHIKLRALTSTANLNDPSVMEAILNQIDAKMKEKGIVRDVRISWIKKPDKDIFHK
ncbi:macrophage mannose receptor 1-like isoform X2 [Trachinotus anak]|uniref:macrophage mannose receptor 1-like isoform X2 n=1 Tax=Trachinotus anak TaxID=443729 RepID=UPI0039F24973